MMAETLIGLTRLFDVWWRMMTG